MDVQLLVTEAVHRDSVGVTDELRAKDGAIEHVRAAPIGHMDDAMIEPDLHH
jgi:hypothetical protein